MKFPKAYENKLRSAYNHLNSAYSIIEEVNQDIRQNYAAFTSPTITEEELEEIQLELEDIQDSAEQTRDNLEVLADLNPPTRT